VSDPASVDEMGFSIAVTQLMKGVVYREQHERAWREVLARQARITDSRR